MKLRLRLIVAFFLLSVVPLAAVTLYSYTNNAKAMREAAGQEAELLAGELTQRMQLVTAQLSERVGHFMDMQRQAEAIESVRAERATAPAPAADAAPTDEAAATSESVSEALGEVAMLLNNIEVRGMRGLGRRGGGPGGGATGRGDGRGGSAPDPRFAGREGGGRGPIPPPPPGAGAPSAAPPVGPAPATGAVPAVPAPAPSPQTAPSAPAPPAAPPAGSSTEAGRPGRGEPGGAAGPRFSADRAGDAARGQPPDRSFRGRPPEPGAPPSGPGSASVSPSASTSSASAITVMRVGPPPPGAPPPPPGANGDDKERILIDMMPIRREIMQQVIGSTEQWDKLSPEDRQRVISEVNQRMLGIVQGIHMGAAELQKKVTEAQRAADTKAREAAKAAKTEPVRTAPSAGVPRGKPAGTNRKIALSGSRLDVTVERDGQVVRQANAEVNLPNLLSTVFSTTRRDKGEVPFAVAKDGHIYTPSSDDLRRVESIGSDAIKAGAAPGTVVTPEWIVVTTADPTGSGLKFGIARPVGESLNDLRRRSARNAALGLGFIGLALIGIVPLSSRLTRNLSILSEGVRRIAQGDYGARVKVTSQDEFGRLATAFNQMAADVEQHQAAAVEQERIKRELELGRQIQHDMLPQAPLRLGLMEIKGVSVPAREVGGDFFNYFALADGRIALLVGDVSGKGVGAALLMANIQASLRTRLALGQGLAAIAREIDIDIEGNTPGPVYATLFVGILNPATRELRYVNAGHNPQYVLRASGVLERMTSSGLPVGLLAGHGYAEAGAQLAPGDLLFFYTDGCVEAENEQDEMFGAERLEALLASAAGADDLLARVQSVVRDFRGRREPFDDATMMVVKVG